MNIFSSQDRSLKVELFEVQNQSKSFTHHPIVSCRRVDGGGSRFLESRWCSACPGFATWFSRDAAMKLSWESWRGLPQNNFKQVTKRQTPAIPWNRSKSSLHNSILLVWKNHLISLKLSHYLSVYPSICLFVQQSFCPSSQPVGHPAIHAMHAVQFNAMQVTSSPFDVLRFDSMYLSQSKANSISFHVISIQ